MTSFHLHDSAVNKQINLQKIGSLPHVGCYMPRHTASSYVAKAVTGSGAVATDAEARKQQEYHAIDHAAYKFQPVAIETFGAYDGEAWDFSCSRLRTVTQDTRSASYLLRRLQRRSATW
jgi:hypothetical protein